MIAKRKRHITETEEHLRIVVHLDKYGFVDDVFYTHIRGERASAVDGIRAKKMGVKRSLPDFMFIPPSDAYGWIEMKERGWRNKRAKSGAYNEHEREQLAMHERLRARGDWVEICETLEEVLDALRRHGMPVRDETLTNERIRRGFSNAMNNE
jgi:hypothetical protein